jgi:hypothetical protein
MAKVVSKRHVIIARTKRPGVHSKNASKGQIGYKNRYRGQGR